MTGMCTHFWQRTRPRFEFKGHNTYLGSPDTFHLCLGGIRRLIGQIRREYVPPQCSPGQLRLICKRITSCLVQLLFIDGRNPLIQWMVHSKSYKEIMQSLKFHLPYSLIISSTPFWLNGRYSSQFGSENIGSSKQTSTPPSP